MTPDGMQPEDVERVFGQDKKTLEDMMPEDIEGGIHSVMFFGMGYENMNTDNRGYIKLVRGDDDIVYHHPDTLDWYRK